MNQPSPKTNTAVDESLNAKPAHMAVIDNATSAATAVVAARFSGAAAAITMAGPRLSIAAPGPAVRGSASAHRLAPIHVNIEPPTDPAMAAAAKITNRRVASAMPKSPIASSVTPQERR